ncbi:MAG: hypothetical protein KC613_01400 [Myxococcales bacterium]|nr:hypothetical protein [Myxococcales bacterium]MCB9523598.1 hypothetical protein [Myxococcales bacterium]
MSKGGFSRIPADAGASGVGLLMQGVGRVLFWLALYLFISLLLAGRHAPLAFLVLAGLSAVRSWVHDRAGRKVAKGDVKALNLYLGVAVAHTAAVVAILLSQEQPVAGALWPLATTLIAWPVTALLILRRSAARERLEGGAVFAEDRGLTGLAALMTGFGALGVLFSGSMLALLLLGKRTPVLLLIVGLALVGSLVARSIIHTRAGWRMLKDFNPEQFRRDREQYQVFAAVSTGLFAVLLVFVALMQTVLLAFIAAPLVGMLMAWPNVVRDFGALELDEWDEHADTALRLAPDAGLSTLGVMLVATASFAAATVVAAFFGASHGAGTLAVLARAFQTGPGWIAAALLAVNLWAGLELLHVTPRVRTAAWSSVGVVATLTLLQTYNLWQDLPPMRHVMSQPALFWIPALQTLAPLVLPVVALMQTYRLPPESALRRLEDVF